MHEITLHDRPGTDGRPVSYTFSFPGSWDECPPEHFACAALARATPQDHAGARFHLLRTLACIPAALADRLPPAEHLIRPALSHADPPSFYADDGPTPELRLLPELDWVFLQAPCLSVSKMPHLQHDDALWHGPDDNLSHMTLDQWRWSLKLLRQFHDERDELRRDTHLNNLLGALYTPAPSGAYPPWSPLSIEAHAARLATLPLDHKVAGAFNFEALNALLPRQYPRTFGGDAAPPSPQGILDISFDVAQGAALGDYDAVNLRLLHTVLAYMENNLYKDERTTARMEEKTL